MATGRGPTRAREQELAAASQLLHRFSGSIIEMTDRVIAATSNHDVLLLSHLYFHPLQRPHQLMAVTGLSRPSVAAIIARFERLGVVQRTFGEHDRRTTLASLTSNGRRRMRELESALEEHFRTLAPLAEEIRGALGCVASRDADPDDGAQWTAIAQAARLSETLAVYDARLGTGANALSDRERVAISTLMAWGLSRPKQLAEALQLSSGGLTYVMDQLESDGIVTRTYGDGEDRRAVFVQLSDEGKKHGRSMCSSLAVSAPEICAALSLVVSRGRADIRG